MALLDNAPSVIDLEIDASVDEFGTSFSERLRLLRDARKPIAEGVEEERNAMRETALNSGNGVSSKEMEENCD